MGSEIAFLLIIRNTQKGEGAIRPTLETSPWYVNAVIGSAVGVSDANGIREPEAGTLEACLTATTGPGRFIPTHKGLELPTSEIAALPTRSGSVKNTTYFPLTPQSLTDFDWLAVLDSTG